MMVIRAFKAAACGVFAGSILWFCCTTFAVLHDHIVEALGSRDKMPPVTKLLEALMPDQQWLLLSGFILFAFGYAWPSWLDEPWPLVCMMHGLVFGALLVTISGVFPLAYVVQGAVGPDPAKMSPLFNIARDTPWIAACSIPCVLAVLTCLSRGGRDEMRHRTTENP